MTYPNIVIIDYSMGNLKSVAKAFEFCGVEVEITNNPSKIKKANAVVLPGVGSFEPAIKFLKQKGIFYILKEQINKKPFLGLCLGFQLLFTISQEAKSGNGLDIIKGEVVRFDFSRFKKNSYMYKVPHIGWNQVKINNTDTSKRIFKGIKDNSYFYFVHSYYGVPNNKSYICGYTDYGIRFCSVLGNNNIWACQFHPEKSGAIGLKLIKNFINEVKRC